MGSTSELEKQAAQFAKQAIEFDNQGSKEKAIAFYQKASECLLRLALTHSDYAPNKVYLQKAIAYQERIRQLKSES